MKPIQKRSILVFSGYNFRAVVALCRQMTKLKIDFGIIALDQDDPVFSTSYHDKVVAVRSSEELNVEKVLPCLVKARNFLKQKESVILPTSEYLNHFLLQNKDILKKYRIRVPLASHEIYKLVTNKESFMNLCADNGLSIPPEVQPEKENIPLVFKPRENICNGVSLYPELVFEEAHLNSFKKENDISLYNCQKYINGQSFYLLYNVHGGTYECEVQENLLQQSEGKSILWARRKTGIKKEISEQYGKLLVNLKFKGLIMIEIKEMNGLDYLIEANPRPWGPIQLIQNTPLMINYLKSLSGSQNFMNLQKCTSGYIWLGGIISELVEHKKLAWYTKEKWAGFKLLKSMFSDDVFLKLDTIKYFFKELRKRSVK